MKKTISFKKNIEFKTMIGEVTAIDLENNLKFIDESNVTGDLIVKGRYKMTEASIAEDTFEHKFPAEIMLTEKLDLNTAKVDVEDFYYEIENEDTMICYIDIKVEGVELLDVEERKETPKIERKTKKSKQKEEKERCIEEDDILPSKEESKQQNTLDDNSKKTEQLTSDLEKNNEKVIEENSLFSNLNDKDETFKTYSVYIIRQEETIETIIEKYQTSKEELEKYNDLSNLSIGTKIIIPSN